MPNEAPEVARLSASLDREGLSPESIRVDLSINTIPATTITVVKTTEDVEVQTPMAADTIATVAQLQAERLAGSDAPNLTLTAEDGRGNTLVMPGYQTAPIISISEASTHFKLAMVGKDATLDALDLSIYKTSYNSGKQRFNGLNTLIEVPSAKGGDLPQIVADVSKALIDSYEPTLNSESIDYTKEMIEAQHEINTSGPFDTWIEILENSDVSYDTWKRLLVKFPNIGKELAEKIKDQLISPTPGFWNKLVTFLSGFQMFYVPSLNSTSQLFRADVKTSDDELEELDISVSSLSLADGSPRLLQPGGVVIMQDPPQTGFNPSTTPSKPRLATYVPRPLSKGFIHREPAPFWISKAYGSILDGSDEISKEKKTNSKLKDLSLSARRSRQGKHKIIAAKLAEEAQTTIDEYAQMVFDEIRLGHSTVDVTMPLDFSVNEKLGKRVIFRATMATGEKTKFTAFCNSISHVMQLQGGMQLQSFTSLSLTHTNFEQ